MNIEELARADQLVALGIPLDEEVLESVRRQRDGLLLSQDPFILSSIIFDLPCQRTGVIATICISALDRVIRLDHAVIDIPWCHYFSWLEDPWRKQPRERAYWFPSHPDLGFEREIVLNHRFQRHTGLFPGDCREGSLLGIGEGAIPEHYRDRQRFPTRLSIFDMRGSRYDLSVDLWVQRERQGLQKKTNTAARRRDLFEQTSGAPVLAGAPTSVSNYRR